MDETKYERALVTGGSRGLGAALGEALAARGTEVVLVGRDATALDEVVTRIRDRGGRAHAITADVADKASVHWIAGIAGAVAGAIDLVVHNASTLGPTPMPLLLDLACEDLAHALEVNLVGPFRLTKALAGPMFVRGRGTVVFVSSDAAVNAYPTWGAYGVSKAALDQLARTFAAEFAGSGVQALTVDPGEMDTAMHAAAMPDADRSQLARPDDVAARIVRMLDALGSTRLPSGTRVEASQWERA